MGGIQCKVRVIDFRAYMQTLPGGELNEVYRPDATHLSKAGAYRVSKDWLLPEILRVYRNAAKEDKAPTSP